ncbi:MAG TPA: PIG-L family deacetylase [Thermoanaerobaculia bacterium]|jgi:LmbE family N-acetylglucosaminyl deacetylase
MTRRLAKPFPVLLLFVSLLRPAAAQVAPAPSPLEPAATGGITVVDRALAKLSAHKRLLVIGAHPDDEDTSLIALVSRGMGGDAAYLSLSRGEGGQNVIGPELGPALGLLRTRELLAARAIDGGRQFFSRAYDFGYTRSLDETLRLWPKDVLVEDAVRVLRRFKPQVVVSVFPGVPHPNHGQHQAAGVTAYAAFPLAGDPRALPQLTAEGLQPWTPQALYRSTYFDPNAATITQSTSGVDPLAGKSVFQLAMASRSMHRSQDMGQIQRLGPQQTRVAWVQGGAGVAGKDLFAGIDTRLSALAATIADAGRRKAVQERLDAAQTTAERARAALTPAHLDAAVPAFLDILKGLQAAGAALAEEDRQVRELLDEKIEIAEAGLAAAAGIAVDATTEREELIAGETFPVQVSLWNDGARAVAAAAVSLVPAPEWGGQPTAGDAKDLAAGALGTWDLKPAVPAAAPPTVPYFLSKPMLGALYDWSGVRPAERGEPFGPPPLVARLSFKIGGVEGVPVTLEREVVHLHRNQALGEVRRPLRVVPEVEVSAADDLLAWPLQSREPRRLRVRLLSHARAAVRGRLEAQDAASGPTAAPQPFTLEAANEPLDLELVLAPPKSLKPGRDTLRLAAVLADGRRFELAVPLVDYPHIRPTPRPVPARLAVQTMDLRLPPLKRVGYVRGASDRVPEFLRQVGVPIEMLGDEQLISGDLGRYDAIVVGSRAYEIDPVLVRANRRLLDYARNGGVVIVQYQQTGYFEGKLAPFPLEMTRDRVTDETAAVTVLDPASPVLNVPNKIGPADWEGWLQERGLNFAHTWDAAYTPLLAMKDPDTEILKGSLLAARAGKGWYVYTGLALFRQLPAGVPGAYRLFANLLALQGSR